MHEDLNQNTNTRTLLERTALSNSELIPLFLRGHQLKNGHLTNHYSHGSYTNQPTILSSLPAKNLQEKWSRITSSPENQSTSTWFLLECTPPRLTPEPSRTSESLNSISAPINQQNPLRPTGIGSLLGESPSGQLNSPFRTTKRNSKNTPNIFRPTSHPYTPAHFGRSSSLTKPSENVRARSTTSPSMNSVNSDISKLATYMDTEPAKAVPSPNRKRARSPELHPTGDKLTHADFGTMENARRKRPRVNTGTFARTAEGPTAKPIVLEANRAVLDQQGHHPRFAWQLIWDSDEDQMGLTSTYSLTAEPLPRPPPSTFTDIALKTISENPHLFKITCLIHVDALERLLTDHPNPLFCQSVLTGLREGFWPWPDKPDEYPETHNNSHRPPKTEEERQFLINQVLSEQRADRLSPPFGPDLLPGMYSPPVHCYILEF